MNCGYLLDLSFFEILVEMILDGFVSLELLALLVNLRLERVLALDDALLQG